MFVDEGQVHTLQAIVNHFKASKTLESSEEWLTKRFDLKSEKVAAFGERIATSAPAEIQEKFIEVLMSSFKAGKVGQYSEFHGIAAYVFGYGSEEAKEMGEA